MTPRTDKKTSAQAGASDRSDRLAEALRKNLRKRKDQARARGGKAVDKSDNKGG